MFWFIFVLCSLILSHILAVRVNGYYISIFFILLTLLLTPAQIDLAEPNLAPSIFLFFFNVLLESEFSLRPLRPLIISMPLCCFLLLLVKFIKNRLFQ